MVLPHWQTNTGPGDRLGWFCLTGRLTLARETASAGSASLADEHQQLRLPQRVLPADLAHVQTRVGRRHRRHRQKLVRRRHLTTTHTHTEWRQVVQSTG